MEMIQQEEKRVRLVGGIFNLEELKDFSGSSALETGRLGKA